MGRLVLCDGFEPPSDKPEVDWDTWCRQWLALLQEKVWLPTLTKYPKGTGYRYEISFHAWLYADRRYTYGGNAKFKVMNYTVTPAVANERLEDRFKADVLKPMNGISGSVPPFPVGTQHSLIPRQIRFFIGELPSS